LDKEKKLLFILIYQNNDRHFLSVYKILQENTLQPVLAKLKITLDTPTGSFFSSSQFQATSTSFIYFTQSKTQGLKKEPPDNRTCLMNTLSKGLDKQSRTILVLSARYQVKFRTFARGFLVLAGHTVDLISPGLDRKLAKYDLKHSFSPDTEFQVVEGTDDFLLFDNAKLFYCRQVGETLRFYLCSVECRRFLIKDRNVCLLDVNGRVVMMRAVWMDDGSKSPVEFESYLTGLEEVKEIWFSSDGRYVLCQDGMNVLRVFCVTSRREVSREFMLFVESLQLCAGNPIKLYMFMNSFYN